jgi:predicted PurR-regulated permease PerM
MSKRLEKVLYIVVIFILTLYALKLINFSYILDIISPLIMGYIFAWLLSPIYNRLNKNNHPKLSITLLITVICLIYILIIILIIPIVKNEITNLIVIIKDFIPKIKSLPYISKLDFDPSVILSSCSNIASILINFALSHIFGFYILYNYKEVNSFLKTLIPKKYKNRVIKMIKGISSNERCFIKGTVLDSLVLFIITLICFKVLHLKYALILALFCSITNIIPFIGPYIGGVPALIVGLSSSINLGILVITVIFVSQTIESNIINPLIMSKCTRINPILIIISITIMGKFFGIFGLLFAVPVLIAVKTYIQKEKNMG